MTDIVQSLKSVRARIGELEKKYDRPAGSVKLLAVSKTKPWQAVLAAAQCGQIAFGENHLQDALTKLDAPALAELDLEWHFIGALQSNKSRPVAERFAWIHSVDRTKLAQRLSEQRPPDLPPLNVCIQVNLSGEKSKSGLDSGEVLALAKDVQGLANLRLRGLMTLPAPTDDPTIQRRDFQRLREIRDELNQSGFDLDTLSMGMTDDLESAIAEGSTMVRIGTAIFGARAKSGG